LVRREPGEKKNNPKESEEGLIFLPFLKITS